VIRALTGIDLDAAIEMAGIAREAVRSGTAGYALLTAEKTSAFTRPWPLMRDRENA
jgi:hypothetical protein